MFFTDVFPIAIALAMDAFALTIANCTAYNFTSRKKEWSMPTAFGIFQMLMPIIGFYIGTTFSSSISAYSGYVTAAVFFCLCAKIVFDIVKEHFKTEEVAIGGEKPVFTIKILVIQAIITSIDAFFIGASSFAFNLSSPFVCSAIVGVITFGIVAGALFIGKAVNNALGKYAEYAGAVILFALAVKELISAIIG